MQLLMGIAVSCESRGSLMEAWKDRSWRQTSRKIGATSRADTVCAVNLELILRCPVVLARSTSPTHPPPGKREELTRDTTSESLRTKQSLNRSVLGDTLQ